jgi:LysR family transcriptional regulator, low CO2-responsive transcriptional regulator
MARLPKLKTLSLFLAVVDGSSMTAAAEAQNLSQPAISTQIKTLESFYGTTLLERSGRRLRPTAAGELVADYARRMLGLASELGEAIADLEGLRSGRFDIGASASAGESVMPELLSRFSRAHPGLDMSLRIGNSATITQAVRQRDLPFGIVGLVETDDELEAWPVIDDELAVFAAPGHRHQATPSLRMSDLAEEILVLREPGSATRDLALAALAEVSYTPASTVQFGSNEAVKRAVAAGMGIGILSRHTLVVDLKAGMIATLAPVDWRCPRQFWLVRRRDRVKTRADRAFFDVLASARARSGAFEPHLA